MMKGGYEVIHGVTLDQIMQVQPHEAWDYASVGSIPSSMTTTYLKQPGNVETRMERNEFSEWVEHDMPADTTAATESFRTDVTMVCSDQDNNSNNVCPSSVLSEFRPRKTLKRTYLEVNGDYQDCHQGNQTNVYDHENNRGLSTVDKQGLNLITLLLECAVAISVDNLGEAHRMLLELTQMASPYGSSCAERVVAYFAKAMSSRVINSWLGICSPLIDHKTVHSVIQGFNNVSPFIKFAHFTSNQAILEAFHRCERVHILDVDIMQGLQWPALFHILATRIEGPPHVRMTGMGTSMEVLVETGKQLSNFAKRLGMSFEFNPIAKKFGEIDDVSMIPVRRGETLAVHWLQHSLYDATGPDWKTMRLLEQLAPRVITLVEQDISHFGSFLDRFVGALHYYSTLFDSLGAYLPADNPSRHRVEHCLLYREINNILAIGGPTRSGEDKFRLWRSELARNGGFVQVPMTGNSMAQAQLILNMFPPAHGYSLVQGDGTLRLGWKETCLFTASAWTSSSCPCR